MKVIISHDVDHILASEHIKDLIVPKFILRNIIEKSLGFISLSEFALRLFSIVKNKWQNIEELMRFDKEHDIAATFFVGVSNGRGLSYSLNDAVFWIKKILEEGFDVGVHGIAFDSENNIRQEYNTFRALSGLMEFGVRIHYLMLADKTLKLFNTTGYLFDATVFSSGNPFKVGDMWVFPLHIMDSLILCWNCQWQNQREQEVQDNTKRIIENSYESGIKYFSILFHDWYFSNNFESWRKWYIWTVEYLQINGFKYTSYKKAIKELSKIL